MVVAKSRKLDGFVICIRESKVPMEITSLVQQHGGTTCRTMTAACTHLLAERSVKEKGKKLLRERQLRKLVGEIEDDPKLGMRCDTAGHPMEWSDYANDGYAEAFSCNRCDVEYDLPVFRWVCVACEDDVCGSCKEGPPATKTK